MASKPGSHSQDSKEIVPGSSKLDTNKSTINIPIPQTSVPSSPGSNVWFKVKTSSKGVEKAKKRLKAFAIQKKTPITVNKPVVSSKTTLPGSGSNTVLIGKLSAVKVTPKPDNKEDADQKKLPKPPKPGQNSYTQLQKRTLSEIEDMKRKMELVELGIPLGLICPTAISEKAMPTKAMPPIKSFLGPDQLDEIIREAKIAKAQGKEFKFDYQKLLPDYDNPFQRKKEEGDEMKKPEPEKEFYKKPDRDKRRNDRFDKDPRRTSFHKKDEKDRRKDERSRYSGRPRDREREGKREPKRPFEKETDVNLSDYLVCDSWSLENEDKTNSSSPKRQESLGPPLEDDKSPSAVPPEPLDKTKEKLIAPDNSMSTPHKNVKKLQPVIDSFKYEIDPDDNETLNIFDENSELEVYSKPTPKKTETDFKFDKMFDYDQSSKDASNEALMEDTFLESVINEIKQEAMSDDDCVKYKGLVEYDSPTKDSVSPKETRSVTPELDDRMREAQSSRSDYSDGYRSTESGYKSTESGYKSSASYKSDNSERYRMSMEKELVKMPKAMVDSLETWSFVLKICQPLLFRHDRNKCYRETRSLPKIWFTENPKLCSCVKDREIVYEELETCKMSLVDRVYGCDQIQESEFPKSRTWYPRFAQCLVESSMVTTVASSMEWEADDSQTETVMVAAKTNTYKASRSTTPMRSEEIYLDREYQRFMEAVWPEASETKSGTPRSTTPVKQETRKKKCEVDVQSQEDKKKAKKIKLSSECWSQESDVEEDVEKNKKVTKMVKVDKGKVRKRRHSASLSDSDNNSKRKRKASKKANKKTKSKSMKHRKISKKYLKKLKDKQKKKKRDVSEDEEVDKENRKKEKKPKMKKLQKKRKAQKKKKAKAKSSSSSSSTSTTSESSSDSETEAQRKKKKKDSEVKNKKRKQSSSDSTQSEDLFDVNILNNIKTERLTDDENKLQFSPRRQKPREIINVKELQSDFVGSVQIKKEIEDTEITEKQKTEKVEVVCQFEVTPETASQKVSESTPTSISESEAKNVHQSASPSVSQSVSESVNEVISPIEKESINHSETDSSHDSISQSVSGNSTEKGPEVITHSIPENIPIPKSDLQITQFKEPLEVNHSIPQDRPEVPPTEELSQCSSQESIISKDPYEKDDSHLRPSSQNSNYSFNDVISASHNYQKHEEDKFEPDSYEEGNYEMYEHLAMAYQSDVAKQGSVASPSRGSERSRRIETVVTRVGEIKCDWRAPPSPAPAALRPQRPSRWGLKPGEVNIVLTGGNTEMYTIPSVVQPVYQIQSLANNRADISTGSYDEAYEDMYGASDRLQYGDCFATEGPTEEPMEVPIESKEVPPSQTEVKKPFTSSLDDRINQVLKSAALEEAPKVVEDDDRDGPEKGILLTKAESRNSKRVSFADGYKPGQDSDVEEPPKIKKKSRRVGCAWPCPASHPDHVPLWDALPPPPPPPGSPPPPFSLQPTLLPPQMMLQQPPPMMQQQPPMLSQPPPQMMSQPPQLMSQPPQLMSQPPQLMSQPPQLMSQPPQMMSQPPQMMAQPPPQMMQQQPPPMLQQQLMHQQQMLQHQGINPAMLQAPPFAMGQKMDPSVSMPNFMPPEPPPGLISF